MKRLATFVMTASLMCIITIPVSGESVLEPYTYRCDFENGSVGAWSSYPPAQDTAYDPTIWVKPLYVNREARNRSLFREITPNYEIDYLFGVRKKLNIFVDGSSVLSFKCFVKSNRNIDGVMVRFGFSDGTDVTRTLPFKERSTWRDMTVGFSDIIPSGSKKKLDAVAFMAVCPNADPENLLRFGLDDVSINGECESNWTFSSPPVHKLDEWPEFIAGKHFKEGGTISISGRASFVAGSVAVVLSRALTGEDSKTFRMRRGDESWSLSIPLTSKTGITSGMWRATVMISSKEKKDETISTDLVFLVKRADAPETNPRLLMRPGDAPKIREKAASGRMKTILDGLISSAKRSRGSRDPDAFRYNLDAYDEKYWLPTYGGYVRAISVPSGYIRSNGVVYGITGDTEAGDAARRAMLMMAKWPSFVHPHILNQGQFTYWPVGQKLSDMAIGFDMSSDCFSASERREAANALYSKGVTEIFKEYVRDNRVSSNTSNWIGDVTSAGILCALAVMDDYEDTELEPYFTGMLLKLNALMQMAFGSDGSYGEGFSYLAHAMHDINPALQALDITFGMRFPEKIERGYRFLLYHSDASTKRLLDFGDSTDRLGRMTSFTYLIAKHRDPHLKWLYDLTPGSGDEDLLVMDDSVEAKGTDELPGVALFRDTGTAIFRSGFDSDDFVFIFRCGPFYNHQHFDQGGFLLNDRGETYLTELGKSSYYSDPWYQKLVIQPGGHNCILIDRNPESQRAGDLLHDVPAWKSFASITDFFSYDNGAFVSGRLDPLYKGKLDVLRRSILYCAPRAVVIIDEADGAHDASEINLRFHAPTRDNISITGKNARITRNNKNLVMRTVAPKSYDAEILTRPLTLTEFGGEDAVTMKPRGFLQLSASVRNSPAVFVNVLSTDENVISRLQEQVRTDCVDLRMQNGTFTINTNLGKSCQAGNVTTDALVYRALDNGYSAMRVSKIVVSGKTLLKADTKLSLVVTSGTIAYSAPEDTKLTLKLDAKPGKVLLNGERTKDWSYSNDAGMTIVLLAGSGEIYVE